MFLVLTISLLFSNINNYNVMNPKKQFYKGIKVFFEGNDGEALTRFILISGRYKKSPFSPWSLYFSAIINDKKGDFRASKKLFSDLVSRYPQFIFNKNIKKRIKWLNKGLKSGGPILMREWRSLWNEKKLNSVWESKTNNFLLRSKDYWLNCKLRLKLAGWYLAKYDLLKSKKQLDLAIKSNDKRCVFVAFKTKVNILLDEGKTKEIIKTATLIKIENSKKLNRFVRESIFRANKVKFYKKINNIIFFVFLLLPVVLIFPIHKKRLNLALILIIFSFGIFFFPSVGLYLSIITCYMGVVLWLIGKKRIEKFWLPILLVFLLFSINVLIVTNIFPWSFIV